MALRLTATTMTLTAPGGATIATGELRGGAWHVTGHPGRCFTRDQAITALTLAEVMAGPPPGNRMWLHMINDWRAELDLPPLPSTTLPPPGR